MRVLPVLVALAAPAAAEPDPAAVRAALAEAVVQCAATVPDGPAAVAALLNAGLGAPQPENWWDGTIRSTFVTPPGSPVVIVTDALGTGASCFVDTGHVGVAEAAGLVQQALDARMPLAANPMAADPGCALFAVSSPAGALRVDLASGVPEVGCREDGSVVVWISRWSAP